MEGKIVAATFTTLALVFAGMSGSSINADVNEVLPSDDSPINDFTSSFSILDSLMENPETENPVKMELTTDGETQLNINAKEIAIEGLNNIESTISADSQENIVLTGFNGNIIINGNETEIIGSVEGFKTSEINVTSQFGIEKVVDTEEINVSGIERNAFTLNAEKFRLSSNKTSSNIEKADTEVEITSFTGDLTIRPPNKILFDGEVAAVNAGSTSFGN